MSTSELQFAVIKDELTAMVDDIIRQFLNDKIYEKDQAQNWCNGISDEIIKALHQQQGSVTVKYENDKMHAFVCLFGLAP